MPRSLIKNKPLTKGKMKTTRAKTDVLVPRSTKKSLYRKVREDMDKKYKRRRK
jgi:hypothetical protein